MGGVAGEEDSVRPEMSRDAGMASEPIRTLNRSEFGQRGVSSDRDHGVGDDVARVRIRTNVDPPTSHGKWAQNHRRNIEVSEVHVEILIPPLDRSVEHRPRDLRICSRKLNARELTGGAVKAVAPDHP